MEFNVYQRKAINAPESHVVCLAAAASGKTAVLTERVRHLIVDKGVAPSDIVAITFTKLSANEMKTRLGDIAEGAFIGTIHSYANNVLLQNGVDTSYYLKNELFDDIVKKAVFIMKLKMPKVKHLLVDEFQDVMPMEFMFLNKIAADNTFYVGDDRQCQPAGTKVKLRNNIVKNIEDVQVGDSVVWYDPQNGYLSGIGIGHNSIEKKVTKVAKRSFANDDLITITTEKGHSTKYTPNHIGFVKLHQSEYNHVVYLMCDDNYRFRIGKITVFSENSDRHNPWREKMYAEGCTKIWLLDVFKTDKEARLLENKLSYKYQIPQICWQVGKVSWTKEDIDYIYEGLDTKTNAAKCLKEFHRDIQYPLLDRATEKCSHIHFAKNAVTEIYAANIMPEIMEVMVYNNDLKKKKEYELITKVDYTYITEPIMVYSLEVEGETYVADDIVTHNCIYQFRGSNDEYLRQFCMDPKYATYVLRINYRNTPDIAAFAEDFLGSYQALSPSSKTAKQEDGYVDECSFNDALDALEEDGNWGSWFILCRTNNQVVKAQDLLTARGIEHVTFKKGDFEEFAELDNILNENRVKILTIHAAKGLQAQNVIVTGAKVFNEEERKISYVAATRAENALYWCPGIAGRHYKKDRPQEKAFVGRRFDKTTVDMVKF